MADAEAYTPRRAHVAQTSINIGPTRYDMRFTRVKCGSERWARGRGAGVGGMERGENGCTLPHRCCISCAN